MNDRAQAVLDFWFDEMVAEKRFKKDKSFDELIKEKFGEDHNKAINNEYDSWQDKPLSCLALIILLDQFSRNLYSCLLYTSPSPRDTERSRMPSSA